LIYNPYDNVYHHAGMLSIVTFVLTDADKQEQIALLCVIIVYPCGTSDLLFSGISTQKVGDIASPVQLDSAILSKIINRPLSH